MRPIKEFSYYLVGSPFGKIAIVWQKAGRMAKVHRLYLPGISVTSEAFAGKEFPGALPRGCPAVVKLGRQIQDFFAGKPVRFALANIAMEKCSAGQRQILMANYSIPRGKVTTYKELAGTLGMNYRRGAQNVGNALKNNPFPIVFPCHRVIRSDGDAGEYQGGSSMKRTLLEMEGVDMLPGTTR